jgi:tight adherence protein B
MAVNLFIAFVGATGIFAAVLAISSPPRARLDAVGGLLEEEVGPVDKLQQKLDQADLHVKAGEFIRVSLLLGVGLAVGGYLMTGTMTSILLGFGAGSFAYYAYLTDRRDRRRQQYQDALVDVIGLLVEGFQSGNTLQAAFRSVADYGPENVGQDWGQVSAQIQAGVSIKKALMELSARRRDPILDTIVQTLVVVQQQGGRLSEALAGLEETVRERVRIRQRVSAEQSQPLWELRMVSALPFVVVPILRGIAPEYKAFMNSPLGEIMFATAWGITILGYYLAQRYITSVTQVEESFGVTEDGKAPVVDLEPGLPSKAEDARKGANG